MNILTIDTVLNKTYIALSYEGKEEYLALIGDDERYHSAYLPQKLDEIFKTVPIEKIDYIGVNTGVGSFTGIRAGLTIAKIISDRMNIKAVLINTFEILKEAYNNENILLDAKRGQAFYFAGGEVELITYLKAEELLDKGVYITDNSLYEKFKGKNLISYEKEDKNLAPYELAIVKRKISENKVVSAYDIKPTYIQTPPIFMK